MTGVERLTEAGTTKVINAVRSHAQRTALFAQEAGHEPARAAGRGLSTMVVVQDLAPVRGQSGLDSTTMRLGLAVRVLLPMQRGAGDEVDPTIVGAVDALMAAYTAGFTLDGLIKQVDVYGSAGGEGLRATFGYLDMQGGTYRFGEITLPLLINDVYDQTP